MGKEGECGVGCQEYQFCSSPKGLIYGSSGEAEQVLENSDHCICMLPRHTMKDGLRKNITLLGPQTVDMRVQGKK